MLILGISAFYHDSASAIIRDGRILAAAQEERFTRKKHDSSFPICSINYCLEIANVKLSNVDFVAFYDKPFLKFERLLETYLAFAPKGFASFKTAMPIWLREKLFQKNILRKKLMALDANFDWKSKLLFSEHHQSHAASAYFPSPFDESVILTMDGVGEWATTTVAHGAENKLEIVRELHFPSSLGLLYSAFTYYTGFKVNSGEYKLMGLAPYGEPRYRDKILNTLMDLKDDGTFRLDQSYFDYCTGLKMTNDKFNELFDLPPRDPETLLTEKHMDLAASVQAVTEEVVLRMTRSLAKETGQKNLCLAGGVALNCVANGKILKDKSFENIWIQPASGDAGGSIGAALCAYHHFQDKPRKPDKDIDSMLGSYLGPEFSDDEIMQTLRNLGGNFTECSSEQIVELTAGALMSNKAVGWFQGRMEFGPRALGNRSILGNPSSPDMQKTLNLKIKYRESFRPFAPSVRLEDTSDWFELDVDSPYMLLVADVVKQRQIAMTEGEKSLFGIDQLNVIRSEIPAVTHVDYSARIQTVDKNDNPKYHSLLGRFKELTNCPILINTSFNVRGEPIVCTPEDAFRCFMGTELDFLAIGNCLLDKRDQDLSLKKDYKNNFEPD